ncbi:hypothetical protein AAE02nite_41630 [Adhaeribacter aerolatus]|uniref:DUF4177 domain-containing protein n=1 Tax=Adhaeribacter aerolatus TaxID=670289 RepID=A0A512B3G3_9BACT|nr:hypothetical protein [Adhaeribacter aerolatus]GEO06499.1 hypothetical protein AAE02nite_41630 [Adhaeribacter aerolatus]
MKKYKVLTTDSAESFEIDLNQLAKQGWKVVSANLTNNGADNLPLFFALLVTNGTDLVLKELLEENIDELNNPENIGLSPSDN